jgi:hypothetical protein
MTDDRIRFGKRPGEHEKEFVLKLAQEVGLTAAARRLGISRLAAASVAAGLDVHGGTLEQVRCARMRSVA